MSVSRLNSAKMPVRGRGGDASATKAQLGPISDTNAGISPAPDRREDVRRTATLETPFRVKRAAIYEHPWFPRSWNFLVLFMVVSILGTLALVDHWPDVSSMILLAASIVLALAVTPLYDLVEDKGKLARLAAAAFAITVPLFLFSYGLALWASAGGLPWDIAIPSLICVSAISVAYLRHYPMTIFGAKLAIWLAVVLVGQSFAGFVALGLSLAIAILVCRDQHEEAMQVDERRRAQDRVQNRARDILADYEETGQGWFWETDRRSLLTYCSDPVARAVGVPSSELIGRPLVDLFDLADTGQERERTLLFHLSARSSFQELAVRAATQADALWWSVSGRPIYDEFDNFIGFRGSGTDLTEKKRSQEQATRLAHYDSLTGLANRHQMSQALEKILEARQEENRACTVMLLDLDRFKQVNDTMGHPVGDVLLKQVAQRLERAVGKYGQVGRLGGDEFKVVIPGRVKRKLLSDLGQEIITALSQPYSVEGQRVIIGASIGIALSPDDGETSEELIRNADLALYAAKDGGRGRFHFYSDDLHAQAEALSKLEEDLRDAITNGDLQMFYQPVVSTASERISGFEALMRWHHPIKGWIPPERFIAVAEECGLISQMGEWALRTACHDLAQWPEEVRVAVNVSPLQFSNPQLPSIVTSALAQAQVHASRLELEITENVFLNNDAGTDAMFASLKKIGVRLALDDFGTGYSSLGYLKTAPFDKIKIDQSFVRGATQAGSRNGAIIASITSLAHALGMDVTAEGVETHDELDLVRVHGCSHVQGFIYARSMNFEQATARLANGLAAVALGPQSARSPRKTMLTKVLLEHQEERYTGIVRNVSASGALIEGLWDVPDGTVFKLHLSETNIISCTTRWCEQDRLGVEFLSPLGDDAEGGRSAIEGRAPAIAKPEPQSRSEQTTNRSRKAG